jgi:secondary thiamine-phosphate synthase enzyme
MVKDSPAGIESERQGKSSISGRPDRSILEDIRQRLAQHDEIGAGGIEVAVENARVTLTGNVESQQACRLAETIVASVPDVQDITRLVTDIVAESGLRAGIVAVFCPGATGGLTTIEYEGGVIADLQQVFDEIAPPDRPYHHHLRWGDDNGSAHVRAALMGPSLTVPFVDGRLTLGTWQQIVFVDFDTTPRSRQLVVQIVGE